jgi:hypothetical protein
MKAILEFSLPDEKYEYELAVKASNYYRCVCDLRETYRSIIKYDAVDKIRDYLDPKVSAEFSDEQIIQLAGAFRELFSAAVEENEAYSINE